jgi:hypothetical protein
MAKDKGKEFVGPMGICECGHTGDGKNSQHGGIHGTGRCHICSCQGMIWEQRTKKYQNFLSGQKTR